MQINDAVLRKKIIKGGLIIFFITGIGALCPFFFNSTPFLLKDWYLSSEKELFYEKNETIPLVRDSSIAVILSKYPISGEFLYKIDQCLENNATRERIRDNVLIFFKDRNIQSSILERLAQIEDTAYIVPAYKIGSSLFFFTGRIRIIFKNTATEEEREHLIHQYKMEIESKYDSLFFVIILKRDKPIFEIIQEILQNNIIESANLDFFRHDTYSPQLTNDRYVKFQWYIDVCGFTYLLKNRTKFSGDSQILIGIIDSGVDAEHEDLKDAIPLKRHYSAKVRRWGVTEALERTKESSGTANAGLICAIKNNQKGICGLGPDGVELYSLNYYSGDTTQQIPITQESVAKCIIEAVEKGVQIININAQLIGNQDISLEMKNALRYALSKNITIVIPAGNIIPHEPSKSNSLTRIVHEPGFEDIIVVGAISKDKDIVKGSAYSEVGWESETENVTLYAGGLDILTCANRLAEKNLKHKEWIVPKNALETEESYAQQKYMYGFFNGTCFASSMVTASVAWIKQAYPKASPKEIKDILIKSAYNHDGVLILNAAKGVFEAQNRASFKH